MIIFINDIPVRLLKPSEESDAGKFNLMIDAATEPITQAKLINNVLLRNVSEEDFDTLLGFLNSKVPTGLLSLVIYPQDYDGIKEYLKSRFKIIKAAGGLVRKKDKFLMIYRMKKWDLPKGKREKKEKHRQTAIREVTEECGITVRIEKKICTTWHTYTMNKNPILKRTRWYLMDLIDDSKMTPATEEDIEELRWMNPKEVYLALNHSYRSISHVFEEYYKLAEVKYPR